MDWKPGSEPADWRAKTFDIVPEDLLDLTIQQLQERLLWQLSEEDARVRRLLPVAPMGWEWVSETQMLDDPSALNRMTYRISYRLKRAYPWT